MIVLDDASMLLYIEPSDPKSDIPVHDELAERMRVAWDKRESPRSGYRGVHTCRCGERSDNKNHTVFTAEGRPLTTNSLCVHYLMWHRDEVPESELDKVRMLPDPS